MPASVEICRTLLDTGADILELGIPFSDPTADGPVIQKAFNRALANPGIHFATCLEAIGEIHAYKKEIPFLILCYYNLVLRYGMEKLLKKCAQENIRGLVIPDLPYDSPEGLQLARTGLDYGVDPIFMITPHTSEERLREMSLPARGFIYYVSSYGVTGTRSNFPPQLPEWVKKCRKITGLPVAVGFGISTPEHANYISTFADGVIVGSANHKIVEENISVPAQIKGKIAAYTKGMIGAISVK